VDRRLSEPGFLSYPSAILLMTCRNGVGSGVRGARAVFLNVRSRLATVCWADRTVAVHSALPVEALDRANLRLVLDTVTKVADDISELIAAVFGGRVASPSQEGAES
jgi:hypothetical protein